MRAIRKTGLLGLLVIATLFVQNASATILLPDSSYAEAENNWQGSRTFTEDGFNVLIEFAVYDTENLQLSGEIALADELDIDSQYIYAYQIFDRLGSEEVTSFAIFDIDEHRLDVDEESIGSQDDEQDGIEPTAAFFTPSNTKGVWEFEGGILIAGEHSWFLVFGSNSEPVSGSYEIQGPEDVPVPPEIPEPGTMALLGVGGAMMILARRRRSV